MREAGAKGPRRRERESHRRRDLRGSDWKWRMERERKMMEREIVKKRKGLLMVGFWEDSDSDEEEDLG